MSLIKAFFGGYHMINENECCVCDVVDGLNDECLFFLHPDGINGFVIRKDVAKNITKQIVVKFGSEWCLSKDNKVKIWKIVHKRALKDMNVDEWKMMGKLKPIKATY